jgi:hypothetical protein
MTDDDLTTTTEDTRTLLELALHGLEVLHSPHFDWGCTPKNCSGQAAIEAIGAELRVAPTRDERWERYVRSQIERIKKAAVG